MESIVLFINSWSKRLNEEWRVLYEGQPRTWKQPVSSHPLPVKHKKRAAMRPQHDLKVRTPGSYTKYACPPQHVESQVKRSSPASSPASDAFFQVHAQNPDQSPSSRTLRLQLESCKPYADARVVVLRHDVMVCLFLRRPIQTHTKKVQICSQSTMPRGLLFQVSLLGTPPAGLVRVPCIYYM